ncbi:MAG TPA: integrin [Kofleriaceae bacterium]|nr:integrin [Kofleriaceae bacterium]
MSVWWCVGAISACAAPIDPPEEADLASTTAAVTAAARGGLAQRAYVKASNTDAGDFFGGSVALSADGSTLAVGAYDEDSAATGVGGDQASNAAPGAGAVYVFRRRGNAWSQEAYLKASNTGELDSFGHSVALSADGATLAVGAYLESSAATGLGGNGADNAASYAGAAYVFERRGARWTQAAYVKAPNTGAGDAFGYSVALSGDGATLAVGAPVEDSAATGVGGDAADNTADAAGAVYVLARSGNAWRHEAYVKASNTDAGDFFGFSVALSGDGATLAVGALFEAGAATGVGGDQASNAAPGAGAAYVFRRHGQTWTQQAYVKASNTAADDAFGASVALSADGATLAVGAYGEDSAATGIGGDEGDQAAPGAGAAYVFARSGGAWTQQAYVKASNTGAGDSFGVALALSADGATLAVGASGEASAATGVGGDPADDTAPAAGAVYLLERCGGAWHPRSYVKASNAGAGDTFGAAVALSGSGAILAANAVGEASAATGVGGDQASNAAPYAGAIYVFRGRR